MSVCRRNCFLPIFIGLAIGLLVSNFVGCNGTTATNTQTVRSILFSREGELGSYLTDETAISNGFVVVHTTQALMAQVSDKTKAIVFTSNTINDVNSNWLRDTYNKGIVIGGINVNMLDLADSVGNSDVLRSNVPKYDPPFASLTATIQCSGGSYRGITSVPLKDFSVFVLMLNGSISAVETACPSSNISK